ncbi:hypothetical protein BH09PSE3_BH09PSE3_05170 [soil metagenome]
MTGNVSAIGNMAGESPQADLMTMSNAEWDDGLTLKPHGGRRLELAEVSTINAASRFLSDGVIHVR